MVKVMKKKEIAWKPAKRPALVSVSNERVKEIPKKKGRTLPWGQHAPLSGCCISTSLKGEPCLQALPVDAQGDLCDMIPYCATCRKNGDPSLLVADHPKFGKILVAERDLPKGYRMAWWGDRTTKKALPEAHWEWALDTHAGMIDARPHQGGSLMQFSACPGPTELTTVWMGPNSDQLLQKKEKLASMLFSTRMDVPKRHQLCMMYNESVSTTDEFFKERGLTRCDVGTPKYPTLKKIGY